MSKPSSSRLLKRLSRDFVLGLLGAAILLNEAFLQNGPERPTLMLVSAALLGLPVWLRVDERRQARASEDE